MDLTPRSIAAYALAVALLAGVGAISGWDPLSVGLGMVVAATVVGVMARGSLVARTVISGVLASAAVLAASGAAEGISVVRVAEAIGAQPMTFLLALPLAAFGVWAGADFKSSLIEIVSRS